MMIRLLVLLVLAGCSPVARIAANTNAIRAEARVLIDHGHEVGDQVVVDGATKIDEKAAAIHGELPKVEDRTPAWLSALSWWGIALACVGVAVILWQTGVGTAIRVAVGWLPRRKIAQAELAIDTLDKSRPESERELVALLRSDPEVDAAYRKAQQRRKAQR